MNWDPIVDEREKKLKTLELKIRMRRFQKLKEELMRVKEFLLNDIESIEKAGEKLPEEFEEIKEELAKCS